MSIFDVLFSYLVRGRMDLRVNRSTGRPRRCSRKNLRSMYPLKVAAAEVQPAFGRLQYPARAGQVSLPTLSYTTLQFVLIFRKTFCRAERRVLPETSHLLASADSDSCNIHLEKDLAISEEIFDYLGKHQGQSSLADAAHASQARNGRLSVKACKDFIRFLTATCEVRGRWRNCRGMGMAADPATGLMLIGP